MKKKVSIVIAAVLAASLFAGCGSKKESSDSIGKTEGKNGDIVLHAATQTDYPPFCFVDENEKLTGFDAELLRLISDRLEGYAIEVKGGEWESMFVSLDSKKLDLVADEVAITAEREENYYFSEPYIEIQSVRQDLMRHPLRICRNTSAMPQGLPGRILSSIIAAG